MKYKYLKILSILEMLLIIGVAIFTFRDLPFTFFQQDEWVSLGLQKIGGIAVELSEIPLYLLLAGLNRPFSAIFKYSIFNTFGTDVLPWAIFAIFVHSLNGLLVRKIARLFGVFHVFATIAGIFYVVCYSGHQSVSWLATSFTAIPSLFFILLSIIFALKQKRILSIACAITSFYFKESSVAWMPLLPLLGNSRWNMRGIGNEFRKYVVLFIFLVFVVIIRIMNLYVSGWESQLSVTVSSSIPKIGIFVNAMLYPLISFSETFLPLPFIRKIVDSIFISRYANLMNAGNINVVKELLVTDIVGLYGTCIFFIGIGFILFFEIKYRKVIFFSIFLLLFSFFPFSVTNRGGEYLDSRYFSFAAAAGGLLISGLLASLVALSNRNKYLRIFCILCLSLFMIGYLYKQSVYIFRDIRYQKIIGEERRNMLQTIRTTYPDLPDKPVLYATGSAEAFYGVSGMRLPLQQGPGYTFMVLFYDTGKIPRNFIGDMLLWGMLDQGYKEVGNQGFGYYHSFDLLQSDMCKNKFGTDQIRGFSYDATNQRITDITQDVVLRMSNCEK